MSLKELYSKKNSGINRNNNSFLKKFYYKNNLDSFFLTKNLVL